MKKRLLMLITVVALIVAMVPVASTAASSEASYSAACLYDMGLFNGTGFDKDGKPIFELDRTPTRAEAVVMLVRLLGKEEAALSGKWSNPFNDVKDWAEKYVAYAYQKGLVNGISSDFFGADNPATAKDYVSIVLRALGYVEGTDFTWENPFIFSNQIGLTYGNYSNNTTVFTRGDVAIISYYALAVVMKDGQTLYDYLSSCGVIGTKGAEAAMIAELEADLDEGPESGMVSLGEFKLTFYCPCSICCGHSCGLTASGTVPKEGRTIATDPSVIPRGSTVYIEGWGTYTAEDTGGAIKSNKIDIYVSSHQRAKNFGVKYAKVWVKYPDK